MAIIGIDMEKLERAALDAYGPDALNGMEGKPRGLMEWAKYPQLDDPEWYANATRPSAALAFFRRNPSHKFTLTYRKLAGDI